MTYRMFTSGVLQIFKVLRNYFLFFSPLWSKAGGFRFSRQISWGVWVGGGGAWTRCPPTRERSSTRHFCHSFLWKKNNWKTCESKKLAAFSHTIEWCHRWCHQMMSSREEREQEEKEGEEEVNPPPQVHSCLVVTCCVQQGAALLRAGRPGALPLVGRGGSGSASRR